MNHRYSFLSLIFCYIVIIGTALFFYPRWEQTRTEATLSWDVSGYYMYLPAWFIYGDIKECAFGDSIINKYYPSPDFQQVYKHEKSGNYVMKYSLGQSIAMLPGFWIGHQRALNSEYPADGFSRPYQQSIGIWLLIFSFVGLFLLRQILLIFFLDITVSLLLIIYVLGTNYLNYAAIDQGMTHNTLFALYAGLIGVTIKFYNKPSLFYAMLIGLLTGWATLIRPTEIISLLIPLFWGITQVSHLKIRWNFFKSNHLKIFVASIFFIMVVSLQPLYWKYVTGDWVVYSYGDQGFSWLKPHIWDYTMSYRCGWLRFTPIMILPFIGLYTMFQQRTPYSIILSIFILLSFYIVTAWDVWDYGGTAGRAMVQYYPILAFPFCVLIEKIRDTFWLKIIFGLLIGALGYIGGWWVYQAHAGQIQPLEMSRAYYWKKLGRWTADEEDAKLLYNRHVFRGTPQNPVKIFFQDFETDTTYNTVSIEGNKKLSLSKVYPHAHIITLTPDMPLKKWLRLTAEFTSVEKEWTLWKQAEWIVRFKHGDKVRHTNSLKIQNFINTGETKTIFMDAKLPNKKWDHAEVFFWYTESEKELQVDDLLIETFEK